jgi:hypothetical protein
MFIWGFRTNSRIVGRLKASCIFCGDTCIQTISEITRVFTLFFIPLFPISKKTETVCTSCGKSYKPIAVGAETPPQKVYLTSTDATASEDGAAKLEVSGTDSRATAILPSGRKNLMVRRSLAVIAVASSFLLILGLANSGFRQSFFGTPGVVTKSVPVYVTPTTLVTWQVGGCVALSADGTSGHPVSCDLPHYAVIVSKVTSKYDCPYYTNYSGSYTQEASWYLKYNFFWCAVPQDVTNP